MGLQNNIQQVKVLIIMYFSSFASLLNMEGHGIYVWTAYGIGLLIIAYNIISPLCARRRIISQIRRQVIIRNKENMCNKTNFLHEHTKD